MTYQYVNLGFHDKELRFFRKDIVTTLDEVDAFRETGKFRHYSFL